MRDVTAWSVGIGRWLGVPVRLHVSFVLLAIVTMLVTTRPPFDVAPPQSLPLWQCGLLLLGVWFASVVLHAAGHVAIISRLRVMTEDVVLTPLGELTEPAYRLDPQREVMTILSGPLANLAAWIACASMLFALGEPSFAGLLNPFYPRELSSGSALVVALKMGMWVNWILVLANLLPAFPLDGGRALQSALASGIGQRRATMVVVRATLITAVALVALAMLLEPAPQRVLLPAWAPLATLAMYLFFHARLEWASPEDVEAEEELFGYDFSQGYTSLERKADPPAAQPPSPLRRWLDRRRRERELRRELIEKDEEQRVDAILERLHQQGPASLSAEDRAVLDRVSARYRSRTRSESA